MLFAKFLKYVNYIIAAAIVSLLLLRHELILTEIGYNPHSNDSTDQIKDRIRVLDSLYSAMLDFTSDVEGSYTNNFSPVSAPMDSLVVNGANNAGRIVAEIKSANENLGPDEQVAIAKTNKTKKIDTARSSRTLIDPKVVRDQKSSDILIKRKSMYRYAQLLDTIATTSQSTRKFVKIVLTGFDVRQVDFFDGKGKKLRPEARDGTIFVFRMQADTLTKIIHIVDKDNGESFSNSFSPRSNFEWIVNRTPKVEGF